MAKDAFLHPAPGGGNSGSSFGWVTLVSGLTVPAGTKTMQPSDQLISQLSNCVIVPRGYVYLLRLKGIVTCSGNKTYYEGYGLGPSLKIASNWTGSTTYPQVGFTASQLINPWGPGQHSGLQNADVIASQGNYGGGVFIDSEKTLSAFLVLHNNDTERGTFTVGASNVSVEALMATL